MKKHKRNELKKIILETYRPKLEKIEKSVEDVPPHEFSSEFEKTIEEAFEKRKKRRRIYYFVGRLKEVTLINVVAASIVLFFGVSIVQKIDAFQIPLVGVVLEVFDSYAGVRIDVNDRRNTEKPQKVEILYEPSWMLKGYERGDVWVNENFYLVHYVNKNSQVIQYYQYFVRMLIEHTIESEKYTKLVENGIIYYYIEEKQNNTLIWSDSNYQYQLTGEVSLKKLKKIAAEIIKVE